MENLEFIDNVTNDLKDIYLAKFCRFNTNNIGALINEYLYFSPTKNLNDVFEGTLYNERINFGLNSSVMDTITNTIKNKVGVCCFSKS